MKNNKTVFTTYFAFDYQREIDELNRQSELGWQLTHGGMFSSKFTRNDQVRYRYQLDYQPNIPEMGRYIDSFREFGWEYVNSTANGWHYFRKVYDSSVPEEEYEIFTDRSSLLEMNSRWAKLGTVLLVLVSVVAVLELALMVIRPAFSTLALVCLYALLALVLLRGVTVMNRAEKPAAHRGNKLLSAVFFPGILLCVVSAFLLMAFRVDMDCTMSAEYMNPISAELSEATLWNTVDVKYADNYYLDVELQAEADVTLTLVDADGETVYTATGASLEEENVRLWLTRGEYKLYLSNFSGGALEAEVELN